MVSFHTDIHLNTLVYSGLHEKFMFLSLRQGGWTKAPKIPVSSSLTGIFVFAGWTDETPRGSLSGGKTVPPPFPCHRRRVLIR